MHPRRQFLLTILQTRKCLLSRYWNTRFSGAEEEFNHLCSSILVFIWDHGFVVFLKKLTTRHWNLPLRSLTSPSEQTKVSFTSLVLLSKVSSSLHPFWIEWESWQSKTKCPCVVSKAIVPADCGCCVLLAFLFFFFFFRAHLMEKIYKFAQGHFFLFPLLLSVSCVSLWWRI